MQSERLVLQVDLPMADVALRRWVADPTTLVVLALPLAVWTAYLGLSGHPLPALALAGLVAALALSGST